MTIFFIMYKIFHKSITFYYSFTLSITVSTLLILRIRMPHYATLLNENLIYAKDNLRKGTHFSVFFKVAELKYVIRRMTGYFSN